MIILERRYYRHKETKSLISYMTVQSTQQRVGKPISQVIEVEEEIAPDGTIRGLSISTFPLDVAAKEITQLLQDGWERVQEGPPAGDLPQLDAPPPVPSKDVLDRATKDIKDKIDFRG